MNEQLQSMLNQLKERIEYFGFTYALCGGAPLVYQSQGVECVSAFVMISHPTKLELAGSFSILIKGGSVECSLKPFCIQGDFEHCYNALWIGLKLWKEYGIDAKASSMLGGEGE